MFNLPSITQLPLGIVIGALSVVAPWMLRPFLIVALVLLMVQGGMLYASGGTSALATALNWLVGIVGTFGFALVGIGLGRIVAQILFGR
jgi:hypothetical protein